MDASFSCSMTKSMNMSRLVLVHAITCPYATILYFLLAAHPSATACRSYGGVRRVLLPRSFSMTILGGSKICKLLCSDAQ